MQVLCSLPEGTQSELIFVYDLPLRATSRRADGEVAEHLLAGVPEVIGWLRAGRATMDASLATLDTLLRHRWIPAADAASTPCSHRPRDACRARSLAARTGNLTNTETKE